MRFSTRRSPTAYIERRQRAGAHRRITGLEQLDKVIYVDQSPIGRTPRSNPATSTGLFDQIREVFAKTPEARARGYKPGRFSFNVKGGRCEACRGDGQTRSRCTSCPTCTSRARSATASGTTARRSRCASRARSICDILEMPIEEAQEFFDSHPPDPPPPRGAGRRRASGTCGSASRATTLSGGEAQRVKLAAELCKVATGRTMYILDEPTTGLHFADIERLLGVLQRLVDPGNTVMVIEHNLDVIRSPTGSSTWDPKAAMKAVR